jgi:hypothetical protein
MTPEQREELRKKWNTRCGPLWFDSKKEGTQASEGSST